MFGKLITAVITPFTANDEIDYRCFKKIIDYVARTSDAIVVGGSTGEGHLLTLTERLNLLQAALLFAPKGLKVIGSVGEAGAKNALEVLAMLNKLNLDGVLISTPYYVLPNQTGIFKYFKKLDSISKHPIILYNVPSRTGVNLNKETVLKLRINCNNIVGIKHASKDLEYIKFLKANDPTILIYSGNDSLLIEALNAGANGIISVGSNAIGEDFKEIIYNFENNIKDEEYEKYYKTIISILEIDTNPIVIKYIMTRLGLCNNNLRLPLCPLEENLQEKINLLFGF